MSKLLDANIRTLKYPKIRRLNTKDPQLVAKYNKEVHQLFLDTGLAKRLFDVKSKARIMGWTQEYE
jgi:hypothetical protein